VKLDTYTTRQSNEYEVSRKSECSGTNTPEFVSVCVVAYDFEREHGGGDEELPVMSRRFLSNGEAPLEVPWNTKVAKATGSVRGELGRYSGQTNKYIMIYWEEHTYV